MRRFIFLLLFGLALLLPGNAFAEVASHGGTPEAGASAGSPGDTAASSAEVISMRDIRFDPRLEAQLPLDLEFQDETGRTVRLGDYLGESPLLLSINYYGCEDLCPIELRSLVDAMNRVTFRLNADYKALTVSLNPADTPEDAKAMRDEVLHRYKRPDAPDGAAGWHFLTGEDAAIHTLTEAVGMKYAYDSRNKTFAHPVGVVLLTPEGRIARYLYGMDFPPNDLRLALYEASQGKISSPVTPLLLLCYHYDAAAGRYTNIAMTIVRTGGILTVLGLGTFLGVMFRRDLRGRKDPLVEPGGAQAPAAPAGEVTEE